MAAHDPGPPGPVIADASFTSAAQRAAAAHADQVQLRCAAPAEVTGQRLAARTGGICDADPDIVRQMAAVETPWPGTVTIDTSQLSPGTPRWCPQSHPPRRCSRPWRLYGRADPNMCGARSGPCSSRTEHLREARLRVRTHWCLHGTSNKAIVPATPRPREVLRRWRVPSARLVIITDSVHHIHGVRLRAELRCCPRTGHGGYGPSAIRPPGCGCGSGG